jgi:GPH family glycoside/pentoside/hexuronide:cation symporter
MNPNPQKLSFLEKAGYSGTDAAANFVFMSMILFQTAFYTDVFGLTASAAGLILLLPRLWDAVADPIVGVLADRTDTRWGKFRPWILFTAVPWCIVMVLAYTTPNGWSMGAMIAYAVITNTMLMSIYSMNNMPYAALGGVMTGDVVERAKLNSFRFIAVNAAQFIVGGFTLPLVAKFAASHAGGAAAVGIADKQYGWQMTMTVWAVLCLILFLITFFTTKERIKPINQEKSSPKQDFVNLLKNNPWKVMFCMTLCHFCILSFRGGALYNYYVHYADRGAMFDWLHRLHLTAPPLAPGELATGLMDKWLGYIVHGNRSDLANSNVADVGYSIINMLGTGTTIVVILLSPPLAKIFGKKAVATTGFALACIGTLAFYFVPPANINGMVALTLFVAICYAPTIPLIWAIYADVADYSEWKTGHRFTGMVFATIGFALKSGLALGSFSFLWIMAGFFHYDTQGTPLFLNGDMNNVASFANVQSMAAKLKTPADPVSVFVKEHLSPETQQALAAYPNANTNQSDVEGFLLQDMNKLIAGPSIYDAQRFTGIALRKDTESRLKENSTKPYDTLCLNRLLLEEAYPAEISRNHQQTPDAKQGFRVCSGMVVGILFGVCTILLVAYQINKKMTIQMADELAERRQKSEAQSPQMT